MFEFDDSGLYFVQDENDFINPLLKVGSGSGSVEKSTGSGWPKINGSDRIRIRILIPDKKPTQFCLKVEYSGLNYKDALVVAGK